VRVVYCCPFLLLVFASVTVCAGARAQSDPAPECLVVDPTPTPLNVRTAPQGQIVGTISNGQSVRILDQAEDAGGKRWAHIANPNSNSRPLGWVFREYLVCR